MSFDYPTVRFKCVKCGICCGDTTEKTRHILLLTEEAEKIAEATKQPVTRFAAKIEDKAPYAFEMKKTIEGYLAEIDKRAPQKAEIETAQERKTEIVAVTEPKVFNFGATESEVNEPGGIDNNRIRPEISAPERLMVSTPGAAPTAAGEGTYIEQITKKRNIIRTYTATVVNNATTKANSFISQGQFDKAKKEVEAAQFTVNENQIHLGDALFKEYSDRLKALTSEIAAKQNEKAQQDEQEKRVAATEAQNKFRQQMEIDRQNRISELMKNALEYQEQQQYEAALGQLKSLLALDPQNDKALILKDTLEDMVFLRKQLDVEKETGRQRADMLLKTDESAIPYPGELTYPKNWREIIEKPTREPEPPLELNPADAKVYDQLEQVIDLPDLTPSMAFADVINELENSVDPPIQIQPNWNDLLENADIVQTTPANMDPLTGVKLRRALELLLAGLSRPDIAEIGYVLDEGIIEIATETFLSRPTVPKGKLIIRVYDITDLVGEPAQYGGIQGLLTGSIVSQLRPQMGRNGSMKKRIQSG